MNSLHSVNVIIPIYRATLHPLEEVSLKQIYTILQNHPLTVVKPASLNLDSLSTRYPQLRFEEFGDHYFRGISGYNRLMMSEEFYRRFIGYEYILIAQLDTYIFRDELKEWCDKGYDYIGAPWIVRPIYHLPPLRFTSWIKKQFCNLFHLPNSQITNFKVGNGGLSLRKTESHLKAVTRLRDTVSVYLSHPGNHIFNEDVFFAIEVNRHGIAFTYPDYQEALQFSFDKHPKLCFRQNNNRLPFGCHSWYKRRMKKFWFPIIKPYE